MKFVASWILSLFILSTSQAFAGSNFDLDRTRLDQGYIQTVANLAVEDLNAMGMHSLCVWSNSGTDQMNGYLNSVLRIVLKTLPATHSTNPLFEGNRVCVMLRKTN